MMALFIALGIGHSFANQVGIRDRASASRAGPPRPITRILLFWAAFVENLATEVCATVTHCAQGNINAIVPGSRNTRVNTATTPVMATQPLSRTFISLTWLGLPFSQSGTLWCCAANGRGHDSDRSDPCRGWRPLWWLVGQPYCTGKEHVIYRLATLSYSEGNSGAI